MELEKLFTVRFNNCIGAVNTIIQHPRMDGRILGLMHHERGALELPGGKIESGETIVQAAVRETYEETGLKVHVLDVESYVTGSEWQGKKHVVATVRAKITDWNHYTDEWLKPTKEGTPVWKYPEQFAAGNFWEYNEPCFRFFRLIDY